MPGLVRLRDHNGQVVMRLLERSSFNRTPEEVQPSVPGNPGAVAGKRSVAKGHGSYVFLDRKTKLLAPYQGTRGA